MEWINAWDKEPSFWEWVYVAYRSFDDDKWSVTLGFFFGDGWRDCVTNEDVVGYDIHWQPHSIPDPPKAKDA